jgi:branched-chain amino acid transport system permease protein
MNTRLLLLTTLNGITLSGLLFIVSSGLALSFGLMRVVNLNHGAFYLTGAYVGFTVQKVLVHAVNNDLASWVLAALAGGVAMAVLAFLEERFLLRLKRVRGNKLVETLLTLAIAIMLADIDLVIWGGDPQSMPLPRALLKPIFLFGSPYSRYRMFVFILAVFIAILLWLLLKKTRVGITIRAGIDDSEIVSTLGINVKRLFTLVFVLSGFLAGSAGVIGGGFAMLGPGEDWRMLQFALVIVIIGGMGSFGGVIIGSLLTAMVFSFASIYLPSFSLFLIFLPVAVILATRPQGLFGRKA